MTETPPTQIPPAEEALRRELERTYESLSQITSRLLLTNEAADAALSTHERVELCERLLEVAARGSGLRRGAVLLCEGESFSLGATRGLDEVEETAAASSSADVAVASAALAEDRIQVLDPVLVSDDARLWLEDDAQHDGAAAEDGEDEEDAEEAEDGADEEEPLDAAADGDDQPVDPGAGGEPLFSIFLPVSLDDTPVAVLAIGERRGGQPYDREALAFLQHLLRQFAVALSRGVLIEANEARVRELDALLRISREITSSLDLEAVLRGVVNTVGALIEVDRAEILLMRGGRLVMRAVSGMTRPDHDQLELFHLARVVEWLELHPERLTIAADDFEDEDPPVAGPVFREYFSAQEMRSFMALPLKDDQGLLGFLCLESRQDGWNVEAAEGDGLDIVAAQTTVAIRNATLYSQIPLRGVARPLTVARTRLDALTPSRRRNLLLVSAAVAVAALLPVFPVRTGGLASVQAIATLGVRTPTDGVVARTFVRGGEDVRAGQPIAEMEDLDLAARNSALEGDAELARRAAAEARQAGDLAAWRAAQIRLSSAGRSLAFGRERARETRLIAPFTGQILELNLDQQVGRHLLSGEAFCTVAALDSMAVEFDVPEERISRVRAGQEVALKVASYPARTFHGRVTEIGWRARPASRGAAHYPVRAELANPGRVLRPGMSGVARVTLGRASLARQFFEPLGRAVAMRWW